MSFLKHYEEDIEKLKLFVQEITAEYEKAHSYIKERYDPISWAKNNPRVLAAIVATLVIIWIYPLLSVWALACIGTGYPGYKIIKSILADREATALSEKKNKEIKEFMHKAATEQKIIQLHIKQNSRLIVRAVIIRGEMDDGLSVKDPTTGIQSKLLWDNIDLDGFYITYIKQT